MEQRAPVTLAHAGEVWEMVDDSCGDQEEFRVLGPPIRERDDESSGEALGGRHRHVAALDTVARQLVTAELVELCGADAVAGQVAVQRM